jgi:hypothetical protein
MSAATVFLSYLWHYVVARAIYDQVVRPLVHGHPGGAVALVCLAVVAFALGRVSRRRA